MGGSDLGGDLRGGTAALSCQLAADRPTEVLELLEAAPYAFWPNQRHGVQALVDLGRHDDAIAYAETKSNPNDHHQIVPACGRILREQGRLDEANERYALEVPAEGPTSPPTARWRRPLVTPTRRSDASRSTHCS